MFSDPNTTTVRLDEDDGAIVAMRTIAEGSIVRREMPDGRVVSRKPILAQVLVFDGERATSETTLVFPEALQRTIEQAPEFAIGTLRKNPHPKRSDWSLWELEKVEDADAKAQAKAAFAELVS